MIETTYLQVKEKQEKIDCVERREKKVKAFGQPERKRERERLE